LGLLCFLGLLGWLSPLSLFSRSNPLRVLSLNLLRLLLAWLSLWLDFGGLLSLLPNLIQSQPFILGELASNL